MQNNHKESSSFMYAGTATDFALEVPKVAIRPATESALAATEAPGIELALEQTIRDKLRSKLEEDTAAVRQALDAGVSDEELDRLSDELERSILMVLNRPQVAQIEAAGKTLPQKCHSCLALPMCGGRMAELEADATNAEVEAQVRRILGV